MIRNGEPGTKFALLDQDGIEHTLESFVGKPVILLFVRGPFCPTTRKSLAAWQDFSRSVNDLGFGILALSADSVENHLEFATQYSIKIPILSDTNLDVARSFGVYLNHNHKNGDYGEPGLVLIDAKGRVAYSIFSSGSKGMPDPGAVASMLIYMNKRGGYY
ncbi:MAG: peroxiredoxin family protein [Armatimonadota bacterium]